MEPLKYCSPMDHSSTVTEHNTQFRVIGAGFGRTGTASFKTALELLGLGPCYHMHEVHLNPDHAELWNKYLSNREKNLKVLDEILAGSGYISSCDFPSATYWEDQLKLYPDAKVVLTYRDPEKWYQSVCETIFRMQVDHPLTSWGTKIFWKFVKPAHNRMKNKAVRDDTFHGKWEKESVIKCYNDHVAHVKKVCPPEKLLVFDPAMGWEPLCKFLNVPVPDVPYPHVNDTNSFKERINRSIYIGYSIALVGVTITALLVSKVVYGTLIPPQITDAAKRVASTYKLA